MIRTHAPQANTEHRAEAGGAAIKQPGGLATLAIISQKGGAGKTTLAINLAIAAERDGKRSLILDIDPQASASAWADVRANPTPLLRPCPPPRIERALEDAAAEGIELALIDTAPHGEGAALTAARAADLIVIPCRPAMFDLHAVAGSIDIARLSGIPTVAVLNAAPPRGPLAGEARATLADAGLDVLAETLGQRAAFVHALTAGQGVCEHEPGGKAAREVERLYAELTQRFQTACRMHAAAERG